MNKVHTLLVEKYRPIELDNYICDDKLKEKFQSFINKQEIPNILLAGRAGSGKTTLSKIFCKNIDCDYLLLNCGDERSIEVMRDRVGSFAAASTFKPLKIILLDEATSLLASAQVLLLNTIETYSLNTRFILTGNYPERLIEPLRSRLQEFDLTPPSKTAIAKHVASILNKEEVKFKLGDVATIINRCYPDLRKILNTCQKLTLNGILTCENLGDQVEDAYFVKIIEQLKKPGKTTFNAIRQIIANQGSNIDFESIYRQLYETMDQWGKGIEGSATVVIEEYKYHSLSRVDGEITVMAMFSRLIDLKTE